MIEMFLGKVYLTPKQEYLVDYLNEVIAKEGFEKVFNVILKEYPKVFKDLPLSVQRRCNALELLLGDKKFKNFMKRALTILTSQRSSINRSGEVEDFTPFQGAAWDAIARLIIALIALLIVIYVSFVRDVEECKEETNIYIENVEKFCREGVARWDGEVEIETEVDVEVEIECFYDDETEEEMFCFDWEEAAAAAAAWAAVEEGEVEIEWEELDIPEEEWEIEWGEWEKQ